MKIIVNPHSLELEKTIDINSGEYNIQECEFVFSNEYNGLTKMAIFSNEEESFETIISNNKCIIPSEILQNDGTIALGVYGYETNEDKLVKRYSPKPVFFNVELGSYQLAQESIDPSSDIISQILQQLGNQAQDIIALENNYDNLVDNVIPTLATKEEIPDLSQYATTEALGTETTNRENADIGLQGQIDAITSSSDVKDIVGTYTDLQNYDTQHLGNNDVIKVLQDNTHNNAMTYYRWLKDTSTWQYIGQEGPYYTKSETETLLLSKQDNLVSGTNIKTINNESLLGSGNINIDSGGLTMLTYGTSTWNDFITAYNNNSIVYCIVNDTRLAFMAYKYTNYVEFQYYRSLSSPSTSSQVDEVYVYKLSSNNSWTTDTRKASTTIATGTGITRSYSSSSRTMTLSVDTTTIAPKTYVDNSIASAIGTALQGNY